MARFIVGTGHAQVAPRNNRRLSLSVEYISDSVIATNNAKIYGKFGSAPVASDDSNSWDFVLNPGAIDGTNQNQSLPEAPNKEELWLIASGADQIVNVVERQIDARPAPSNSGAAAS